MRINKYIASCGIASRRKADQLIETGKIAVNGDKILEPGYKVQESDIVTYCGEIISPVKEKYYLMLNKPIDYVCTNDDPFAKKTVFDLIDIDAKLFSIGRLDKDSRGLLLITNDGDLYNKLMHPSKLIFKKYKVILDKSFDKKHIKQLSEGVDIGGYVTSQAKIQCTNDRKILCCYNKKD